MRQLIKTISLVAGVLASGSVVAKVYEAPVTESDWTFSSSRVSCQLKHSIPHYGQAIFEQRSGERVQFTLKVDPLKPAIQEAQLQAIPPAWMHNVQPVNLQQVKQTKPQHQVHLKGDIVETMLQVLSEGRFPQFRYQPVKSSQIDTRVAISSINFLQASESFDACRAELLPFSQANLDEKFVLFRRGSEELTPRMRRLLRNAVQYVKEAGPDAKLDLVRGDEDFSVKTSRMRYNERVSAVRDFLKQNGLDDSRIRILNTQDEEFTDTDSIRLQLAGPEPFQLIYFHSGSKVLNDRDRKKLDFMLDYMKQMPLGGTVTLLGHTDSKGPRYSNLNLSKQRIESIRQYLLSKGLNPNQIKYKAFGESKPVSTNRFPSGRELNRRVAIKING